MPRVMQVARGSAEVSKNDNSIVTIGTFDGVHLGHRAILDEVVRRARSVQGRAVLVTFDPHPRQVVRSEAVPLLTTMDERVVLFREAGLDVTVIVEFTYEFSRRTAESFYGDLIVGGIGVREVIVGHDHMFGRDRRAGSGTLRIMGESLGFGTTIVGPVHRAEGKVSSSRIRGLLASGAVAEAGDLLGRYYGISGTVMTGDGRGTKIGFPTANIEPDSPDKIIPGHGVYLVRAGWEGNSRYGMLNIGVRPTFVEDGAGVVEVHLFDWKEPMYGKSIGVEFIRKIRDEKKFRSEQEFVTQLEQDRNECLSLVSVVQEP
jgi:riboflavin kinase/FMN adenylyltransferase